MRIEPTTRNKAKLLKKSPLTSCVLVPGWSNSGWLADTIAVYPNKSKTDKTYENDRDNIVETKLRHERLLKEAEQQKDDNWRLDDEESDEEIALKLRELLGPQASKVRPVGSKSLTLGASYASGQDQIVRQMKRAESHLREKQKDFAKINSLIEEKKQNLFEAAEEELSENEA